MRFERKKEIRTQRGATSLLIVVGLSMALIVIIGGLTALSIRESRQALDTDLSNRALAAAEAAATDGAQRLVDNPDIQVPNCSGTDGVENLPTGTSAADIQKPNIANAEIVCRTIVNNASTIQQQVNQDESTQFFTYLGNTTGVNRFKLLWGEGGVENAAYGGDVFPSALSNSNPAVIELIFVYWPKTGGAPGTVGNTGFETNTTVVMPTNASSPARSVNCDGNKTGEASLNTNRVYSCSAELDLDSLVGGDAINKNIVVKVKARYKNAPIQTQFYNGGFNPSQIVKIKSNKAVIDVTAKVGSIYRRIQAEKPIMPSSFFDDVMYSKAGICKNLQVKEDKSLISGNNCS